MTDNELKSDYKDIYDICSDGWSDFLSNAEIDLSYYCAAQHTLEELEKADEQGRILHTIDKTARQVNLLHGYEIRNRHILKIGATGMPEEREDEACRQHTGVILSLMSRNGGYSCMSNAFKWGNLIQGSNLFEFWRDRDGILRFNRMGWNQFLLNPSLTQTDLSDCDDILTGRWISKDKAKMLVPTAKREIDQITPLKFADRWNYLGSPILGNKAGNRMYEEWWRRRVEYIPTVISRFSGEELSFKDFAAKFYGGDADYANGKIAEMKLPSGKPALSKYGKPYDFIELTIFIDGEPVWTGKNPLKMRDYNFVWFHGDWCPECPRAELKLRSFIRGVREPQRAENRRINQIYDIIESQIQAGRVVRSKYLMNPEDSYKSGQGIVLHTNEDFPDGMTLSEVIHQFNGADVPQGLFQALEITERAITESGGLNQEIFGTDDKEISGISRIYRTGQALTGQGGIFQGFLDSKIQIGKKLVRLLQLNYEPSMITEIINEQPVQGFYEENLTKFDCTPVEGLLTDTQQQLFYEELKSLRANDPAFQELIPPSLMIKYFPGQVRGELIKAIQQGEQQRQQQAQQAQQVQERMNRLVEAQTASDIAKSQEDISDIQVNRTQMALNRVKTAVEIQNLQAEPVNEAMKRAIDLEKIRSTNNGSNNNRS